MPQIKDKTFVPFLNKEKIQARVQELATQINKDYEGKNPIFIGILNGSFMFIADLFRQITIDCEISFVRVSSYQSTQTSGKVKQVLGLNENINGRHVIIVEDIVDTGLTMHEILGYFASHQPESLKVATLLFKPTALKSDIKLAYVGFEIENKFVVGYGLDYDGLGRNFDEIYVLKE